MAYNRWLSNPQNGSELYHYGVKGMKWKNHKAAVEVQTNGAGGGGAIDPNTPAPGSFATEEAQYAYEQNAFYRAYQKKKEESKPAWQKKWDKSEAKQTLWRIKQQIKKKLKVSSRTHYKAPKKKKSRITAQWDDGSTTTIR